MIFDRSLDHQLKCLITDPLNDLAPFGFFNNKATAPRLVIIDGLDECLRHDQRNHILRVIARALREHHIPLIFLVSSRPESDIIATLHSQDLKNIWHSLVLDNSFSPGHDIRIFMNDSFLHIKEDTSNACTPSTRLATNGRRRDTCPGNHLASSYTLPWSSNLSLLTPNYPITNWTPC